MVKNENTIFEASYDDRVESVRTCVVDYGVDPNIQHPRSGHTPLQAAAEVDAIAAMEELLRLGADPNLRFTKISRVDGHIIGGVESVALMHVVSVNAAKLLVSYGAKVDVLDKSGLTPRDYASQDGNIELTNYFDKIINQ